MIGPREIVATLGDDVTLPCNLEPAVDAVSMTLEWARPDLKPRFVFVWHNGQEFLINKHPSYKGRTSVSIDGLKHGNISLRLSNVKLSDEGKYRCFLPKLDTQTNIELVVGKYTHNVFSMNGNNVPKWVIDVVFCKLEHFWQYLAFTYQVCIQPILRFRE